MSATLMKLRSARPIGSRLRSVPMGLSVQTRAKTTMPFRLPDARNEPNVSVTTTQRTSNANRTIAYIQERLSGARQA